MVHAACFRDDESCYHTDQQTSSMDFLRVGTGILDLKSTIPTFQHQEIHERRVQDGDI
jgi:hypothetical protein